MSGAVRFEQGRTAVITIDAPERRNAVSAAMRDQLAAALYEAMADDRCRAIVLTGAGGHFCAGFDVGDMASGEDRDDDDLRDRLNRLHAIVRLIVLGPKPVVAAVEGFAAGAGLSFAAACDFIVAAEGAQFVASWGRLALAADCGALWLLPRRVGQGHVRDLLFSARRCGQAEAVAIGLADAGAAKGGALAAGIERADGYAATSPGSIAATKTALARLGAADLDAALMLEIELQRDLKMSPEHDEARRAFMEKRTPGFAAAA